MEVGSDLCEHQNLHVFPAPPLHRSSQIAGLSATHSEMVFTQHFLSANDVFFKPVTSAAEYSLTVLDRLRLWLYPEKSWLRKTATAPKNAL